MPWGKVVGLAVGASLSYFFILPAGVLLTLQFTAIPIGDLLRVFGAIVVTVTAVGIGHFVDVL